jgi:transposase
MSEKARIVAETLVPGASVSEVARHWQVCAQQVFTWRREAGAGHLALPCDAAVARCDCVPIITQAQRLPDDEDASVAVAGRAGKAASAPVIEVRLAGATVRVPVGTDVMLLADVLRAVRASAA